MGCAPGCAAYSPSTQACGARRQHGLLHGQHQPGLDAPFIPAAVKAYVYMWRAVSRCGPAAGTAKNGTGADHAVLHALRALLPSAHAVRLRLVLIIVPPPRAYLLALLMLAKESCGFSPPSVQQEHPLLHGYEQPLGAFVPPSE